MTETSLNPHWIMLEGAFNVRDTGGYPASGGMTRPDGLLRADSLHKLTDADREILLARGLSTVIDLRHASEVSAAANVFANSDVVNYQPVPIFEDQPDGSDASIPDLVTIYRYMTDMCQTGVLRALQAIARAPEGAVLIHCTAGKNRTGVLTALALGAVGVPREFIVADYALTTEAMQRLRPRLMSNASTELPPEVAVRMEQLLASNPEIITDLLDYVDAHYGGVDAYLADIGCAPGDLERLRTRLVQPSQETRNG